MTPYGVGMRECEWGEFASVESTSFGSALGSPWEIGVVGVNHAGIMAGPSRAPYSKSLVGRYMECGIQAVGGDCGVIGIRQLKFSSGMEAAITNRMFPSRLSVDSCVGILSLQTVRGQRSDGPWEKE